MPIVRSSKECTQANAKTILVNPHNANQDLETGAMCTPMSIIQNLNITLNFYGIQQMIDDEIKTVHGWWMPFFASFGEKYDVADDDTGITVQTAMQLTKDETNEDVVPLTTQKLDTTGSSDTLHPVSTVNFAEVAATLNYSTDLTMESAEFNEDQFHNLLSHGTNNIKGALKACIGRKRHFTVGQDPTSINVKRYNIRGFLPRAVRRILPFGFFGILAFIPLISAFNQTYTADASLTADLGHVGVKMFVTYDEWNEQHDNTM